MHRLLWLTENYPPDRGGMSVSCAVPYWRAAKPSCEQAFCPPAKDCNEGD